MFKNTLPKPRSYSGSLPQHCILLEVLVTPAVVLGAVTWAFRTSGPNQRY